MIYKKNKKYLFAKTTFHKNDLSSLLSCLNIKQHILFCTPRSTMYPRTPTTSPAHKQCPQRPHKQRPPRPAFSIRAPLAGSFKLTSRKLVYTQSETHMDPPHLDLGLPLVPLLHGPALQDIHNVQAAHLAFHTLCLQTN